MPKVRPETALNPLLLNMLIKRVQRVIQRCSVLRFLKEQNLQMFRCLDIFMTILCFGAQFIQCAFCAGARACALAAWASTAWSPWKGRLGAGENI